MLGAHHLVDGQLYTVGLPFAPHLPFTYPPIAAVAFWPLAHLPRQAGQLVWAAINVASLYGIIALSLRAVAPGHGPDPAAPVVGGARSGRPASSSRCGSPSTSARSTWCSAWPSWPT